MKALLTISAIAILLSSPTAFARRGADDPAGHVRGEGAGHASLNVSDDLMQMARRGRGADDAPGDQRQCRGCDDPAGHASIQTLDEIMQLARRGADDPAGDVRGEGAGHA